MDIKIAGEMTIIENYNEDFEVWRRGMEMENSLRMELEKMLQE